MRDLTNDAQEDQPPLQLDSKTLVTLAFLLGSATTLGASSIYRRFFKRIKNAEWVTPTMLKRKRWITGVVTNVGDADNFRLYHTPGFGWRGPLKFRHIPTHFRELKGKTIHIRVAGMDAPELSHFGRPAQPYSAQALEWLKENVEGRSIKCQLLRRDQYQRIVALPLIPRRHWRWWWWWLARVHTTRNLSLEMVRAGWGAVYEKTGAEYGQWNKEAYVAAQSEAQAARRGIWQGGMNIELPAEYKKRHRTTEQARIGEEELVGVPESKPRGFLSRLFGQIKRGGRGNTS
ncbi:hypothetical protein BGW80DRAFT_744202 [Lactifluus volemus]|nr:hypothetical protein BGW80DRAFT_744202 [Lactifluus volemus]